MSKQRRIASGEVSQPLRRLPAMSLEPTNIQQIGDELAIAWNDGTELFLKLEVLRRAAPDVDQPILGNASEGGIRTGTLGSTGPAGDVGASCSRLSRPEVGSAMAVTVRQCTRAATLSSADVPLIGGASSGGRSSQASGFAGGR